MDLDHDACYRLFQARDARFDGRVFIAVRTTGIYCRPICPARTPKKVNVEFFVSAAAARDAGFRPCLRCRPEVAPELAAWNGTSSTVTRALRLIEAGAFDEPDIDILAERVGIGARHLRRLFAKHVGASPGAVFQTRRIHLAKQLIQETSIPMTQVAHVSGFGSIRRFNETFKDLFGRPPTHLRRSRTSSAPDSATDNTTDDMRRGITLRLPYSPPFAWDEMLALLGTHAIRGIEAIVGDTYARSIAVQGHPGIIAIGPGRRGELVLRVHSFRIDILSAVISRVRSMCDLSADPRAINAHLSADPLLAPLIAARPGLRIGGAWAGFEIATRAILEQDITTVAARALASSLVDEWGQRLDASLGQLYAGVTHLFPESAQLADADLSALRMPRARADALQVFARALASHPTMLSQGRSLQESLRILTSLPGIDDWTAQHIAMRELREPDAFPATDVALLRAAQRLLGRRLSPAQLLQRAERWRPWRAYAAAHLWASVQCALSSSLNADQRSSGKKMRAPSSSTRRRVPGIVFSSQRAHFTSK
jgi:AraC family transcriptional regulator of adaptative response / DNA-3-methyladenine glycosylase II